MSEKSMLDSQSQDTLHLDEAGSLPDGPSSKILLKQILVTIRLLSFLLNSNFVTSSYLYDTFGEGPALEFIGQVLL